MKTSATGIALIKEYTAFSLKPIDLGGVLSIGWGHTRDVRGSQVITQAEAEGLLYSDIKLVETAINEFVTVPLEQCQFDALVSVVLSIGIAAFLGSTMLILLNKGEYIEVPLQFDRWLKGEGSKPVKGIRRRRKSEGILFLQSMAFVDRPNLPEEEKKGGWGAYHRKKKESVGNESTPASLA